MKHIGHIKKGDRIKFQLDKKGYGILDGLKDSGIIVASKHFGSFKVHSGNCIILVRQHEIIEKLK